VESLDFIDNFLRKNAEKYMKMATDNNLYKKLLAKEILGCTGNVLAHKESTFIKSITEEHKDNYYFGKLIIELSCHYIGNTPKIVKTGLTNLINLGTYGKLYFNS